MTMTHHPATPDDMVPLEGRADHERQLLTRAGLSEEDAARLAGGDHERAKAMLLNFLEDCIRVERDHADRVEIGKNRAYTEVFAKQDLDYRRTRQHRFEAIKRIVESS